MTGGNATPNPVPEDDLLDEPPLKPLDPLLENLCEPKLPVEPLNLFDPLPPEDATV